MGRRSNQKLKLFYLIDILRRKTDDEHELQISEISKELEACGVKCERKTFYTDCNELRRYGYDIQGRKEGNYFYYRLGKREFDLLELKLIIDAVRSAKFITERKSNSLSQKIEQQGSDYQKEKLHRQVLVAGRVTTMNESVYSNVDTIHHAINHKKQIKFQYAQWTLKKKLEKCHGGDFYLITPWAVVWEDETYYLVGYDPLLDMIQHYRVDKMIDISEVDLQPEGKKLFQSLNTADYVKQNFGMFSGPLKEVELLVSNDLVGVMIDRFGKKIPIISSDEEHFKTSVKVAVSPQFYGWILSLGNDVKIIGPEDVEKEMKIKAKAIASLYK